MLKHVFKWKLLWVQGLPRAVRMILLRAGAARRVHGRGFVWGLRPYLGDKWVSDRLCQALFFLTRGSSKTRCAKCQSLTCSRLSTLQDGLCPKKTSEQFPLCGTQWTVSLVFPCLLLSGSLFPCLPFPSLICSSLMFGWLVGRVGGWVRCLVGLVG